MMESRVTSKRKNRFFFFNDTATTEIYTLSLHDALPIFRRRPAEPRVQARGLGLPELRGHHHRRRPGGEDRQGDRKSHTSELQSRQYLVCRLLLEKTPRAPLL